MFYLNYLSLTSAHVHVSRHLFFSLNSCSTQKRIQLSQPFPFLSHLSLSSFTYGFLRSNLISDEFEQKKKENPELNPTQTRTARVGFELGYSGWSRVGFRFKKYLQVRARVGFKLRYSGWSQVGFRFKQYLQVQVWSWVVHQPNPTQLHLHP